MNKIIIKLKMLLDKEIFKKIKRGRIYFKTILIEEKTPTNDLINEAQFIVVMSEKKPIWALFKCPCGCGYVISLSLNKWRFQKTKNNRPTLYPSIWQNSGCHSHFWLT